MFLEGLESTRVAIAIKQSIWLFPCIEIAHLLALAMLAGTSLFFNLWMLEREISPQAIVALEKTTRPWLISSLTLLLISGALLFFSEAIHLSQNPAFIIKIIFLFFYLVAVFCSRTRLASIARFHRKLDALLATASTILLLLTAAAGRWIGFY